MMHRAGRRARCGFRKGMGMGDDKAPVGNMEMPVDRCVKKEP